MAAATRAELAAAFAPQGLEDRARVAHQIDYAVKANWKLVWENNRECWHCHAGHPEYIRANFDTAPDTERTRELVAARAGDHAKLLGTDIDHLEPGLYPFPTPDRWWSANRTALAPGYVTESIDGEPVAPLMGDYRGYDIGTLRARAVPNFWCHASADHAVLTRLTPAAPELTWIRVQWLVDRDAVEGRDYDLDRLLPFWQLTSEQDWNLCERNHAGVRNLAFIPGPYSRRREANLVAFVDWYLSRL
jgi:Rieske 2Fe-2S family protein